MKILKKHDVNAPIGSDVYGQDDNIGIVAISIYLDEYSSIKLHRRLVSHMGILIRYFVCLVILNDKN